jgi:uncharacterized protein (TIGR03083 family)
VTTTTDQRPSKASARQSSIDHDMAMKLAEVEYDRVVALFEELTPEQWSLPTNCADWDVRAMAGHMLGMVQMLATVPELVRQQISSQRRAKKTGSVNIDAMTALQVEKNARLTPAEVVAQTRALAPKAVRGRRRMPGPIRRQRMAELQRIGDSDEWWTMGYLVDVILTRDPFMHRLDIALATGNPPAATPDHEGVLVDDVVREWAGRHGQPFRLELSGPVGGTWGDADQPAITMDAFDFLRALGGRGAAPGLLRHQVPF